MLWGWLAVQLPGLSWGSSTHVTDPNRDCSTVPRHFPAPGMSN